MNKKAIATDTIITLIIFVLVLGLFFMIYLNIGRTLGLKSNAAAINTWVQARSFTKGVDVAVSPIPPVIDLEEPLEVDSKNDLLYEAGKPPKVFGEISDSMIECWNAFDKGQTDFLHATNKKVFCFPCRAITFSKEIKNEKFELIGFNRYINEKTTKGEGSPTYLQYLANDNFYKLDDEDLQDDKILVDDDLYIYFFAASGKEWSKLVGITLYSIGNVVTFGVPELVLGSPDEVFELKEPKKTGYKPTDVKSQPAVTRPGEDTGVQETAHATVVGGTILFKKQISSAVAKSIAGDSAKESLKFVAGEGYVLEMQTAKSASKLGRFVGKNVVKVLGSRLFTPIAAGIAVAEIGEAGWRIIFNEKDFVATTLLGDQKTIVEKCSKL